MEELLHTLVGFRSVSGDAAQLKAIVQFVDDYLSQRGMFVERFESQGFPSLVATTQPGDRSPAVLFVIHLDVVPGEDRHFAVRQQGDKLLGRGVFDMKFAAAAALWLADQLRDRLADYDFGIMFTTDEEVGGRNGVKYLVETQGYRADVCIVPDGGPDWQLEEFEKGVQWIKLEATGVSAHAARPWEGEHAIHKLLHALADIRHLFPAQDDKKATTLSVGTIHGGQTANQIAEHAEAMLDIRTASQADHTRAFPAIQAVCQKHDVQAVQLVNDAPCINSPDNPYIARFRDIMTRVTGRATGPFYSYAVTDGRFFTPLHIPCVIVQPPGGENHADGEWISAKGVQQFYDIVREYIEATARRRA